MTGGFGLRAFLLALAVVAVWGTNFVFIRLGLDTLPPLLFAALRERIDSGDVPAAFEGTPIALVTAGLMALAFMGFSGLGGS